MRTCRHAADKAPENCGSPRCLAMGHCSEASEAELLAFAATAPASAQPQDAGRVAQAAALKRLHRRRSSIVCGILTARACDKIDAELDAAIDALATSAPPAAAPAGWKVVPVDPRGFIRAGAFVPRGARIFDSPDSESLREIIGFADALAVWCAMLAAAPAAPAAAPMGGEGATDAQMLDWLATHVDMDVDWGEPEGGNEEDPCVWRVTQQVGGRNDREWRFVGQGNTPRDAVRAAMRATESGARHD